MTRRKGQNEGDKAIADTPSVTYGDTHPSKGWARYTRYARYEETGEGEGEEMKVKTAAEIEEFLRPVAEEVGVEIIEVKWDMRNRALTLFIDAEGGVDLNLCEKFHNAVDAPLDELDPTYGAAYTLNCSSPGLDRPFKTERDFLRHMGEKIEVHLYAPLDGKKYYEGVLTGFDGKTVKFQTEGKEKEIPLEACAKVCLLIEV